MDQACRLVNQRLLFIFACGHASLYVFELRWYGMEQDLLILEDGELPVMLRAKVLRCS